MATAKIYNLDILLWGYRQLDEAIKEIKKERREKAFASLRGMTITECPCGCGLLGDFCDTHLATIAAREELPF